MRNVSNFHKFRKGKITGFAIYGEDATRNAGKWTGINFKGNRTM